MAPPSALALAGAIGAGVLAAWAGTSSQPLLRNLAAQGQFVRWLLSSKEPRIVTIATERDVDASWPIAMAAAVA